MAQQTQRIQKTDSGRKPEGEEATRADQLFRRLADLVTRLDAGVEQLAAAVAAWEGRAR